MRINSELVNRFKIGANRTGPKASNIFRTILYIDPLIPHSGTAKWNNRSNWETDTKLHVDPHVLVLLR